MQRYRPIITSWWIPAPRQKVEFHPLFYFKENLWHRTRFLHYHLLRKLSD